MEETKIIKFVLGKGFKFTGREISSKLVVSKNKDLEGNCVTLIMSKRKGLYFFHPIADIYLDYNKLQLIMPNISCICLLDLCLGEEVYDGF